MLHTATQGYFITQTASFTLHEIVTIERNYWDTILFKKLALNHALSLPI
jgi:hypothetical protein